MTLYVTSHDDDDDDYYYYYYYRGIECRAYQVL